MSKRMQMVADMVTKGNVAADIGCDHGFVSIYLIEQNICPRVIAMDVNEGPLLRAKEHITKHGLESYIDVRLSDGIERLNEKEADSILIAGMGGRLVMRILSDHMDKVRMLKEVILQPQSELYLVRRFLQEQGFVILQEDMVEEAGKYYPSMKVVYKGVEAESLSESGESSSFSQNEGKSLLSEVEEWYGPMLLKEKHPVLHRYLLREKSTFEQILREIRENAKQSTAEDTKEETIQNRIRQIAMALAYFEDREV